MPEIKQTKFLRKTKKIGNSCGVILPKYLLGADVRVLVVNLPSHPKKDLPKILEDYLDNLLGIYILKKDEKTIEVLAVSTNLREQIKKRHYRINIVPLQTLKKSLKLNKEFYKKLQNAEVIINKKLLSELKNSV